MNYEIRRYINNRNDGKEKKSYEMILIIKKILTIWKLNSEKCNEPKSKNIAVNNLTNQSLHNEKTGKKKKKKIDKIKRDKWIEWKLTILKIFYNTINVSTEHRQKIMKQGKIERVDDW